MLEKSGFYWDTAKNRRLIEIFKALIFPKKDKAKLYGKSVGFHGQYNEL